MTEPFGQRICEAELRVHCRIALAGNPAKETPCRDASTIVDPARSRRGQRQAAPDHRGRARGVPGPGLRRRQHERHRPQGRRLEGHALRLLQEQGRLFEAITEEQCQLQAEQRVRARSGRSRRRGGADAARQCASRTFMCNRSTSPIRTVIAIADRMPEVGRQFYETGPAVGIAQARALSAGPGRGRRARTVEDCDIAAGQFLESCLPATFKPVLFNFAPPPPHERIAHVVGIAVRAFMKAYGKKLSTAPYSARPRESGDRVLRQIRGSLFPGFPLSRE